jgi:catechol 2,3-dioxygenase-like lactoylglutathione lyase family enzyme
LNTQTFGPIGQVAYLVDDVEASALRWSRFSGIGPWTIYKNVTLPGQYRGVDTNIVMHVALSYQDALQIELIQPAGGMPSPYCDAEGRTLLGMHHVAFMTPDLPRDMEKAAGNGLVQTFEARNEATHVAYFESPDEPGLRFEFFQTTPMLLEGFAAGIAASRAWDGKQHILQLIDFAAF